MSLSKLFRTFTAAALLVGAAQAHAVIITIDDTSDNNGTEASGEMDFTVAGAVAVRT